MDFNHLTLKDRVVLYIRQAILSGQLKPGDRIIPGEIAEKLGISRGPIREALRELEKESLVRSTPYKGTFVTTMTEKEVEEICSIRGLLEGFAVRLAIGHITQKHVKQIEEILKRMDQFANRGDAFGVAQTELEFHSWILKSANHTLLYKTWADTNTQITSLFVTFQNKLNISLKEVVKRHYDLLYPIMERNIDQAYHAVLNHYIALSEDYSRLYRSSHKSKKSETAINGQLNVLLRKYS